MRCLSVAADLCSLLPPLVPALTMFVLRLPTLLLTAALLLALGTGCSKDSKEDPQPAASASAGEVTYTYLGATYTITDAREVSAIYETCSNRLFITATPAGKPGVTFGLMAVVASVNAQPFLRGTTADACPLIAELTRYDAAATTKPIFSSLYAPATTNGQITITEYDLAAGKLSGTFSFTGGAVAHTGATGTAAVAGGTFRFTRITTI